MINSSSHFPNGQTAKLFRAGSSALAITLILVLGGTAIVIALNARAAANRADHSGPQEEERKDIFKDLPPDVPKPRQHQSTTLLDQPAAVLPADEEDWNLANDYARRAKIALQEAIAAQKSGAKDLASKKGAEAQELYTRALESANPWLEAISSKYGREDPLVLRVDKITSGWAREVMALKKSAGL